MRILLFHDKTNLSFRDLKDVRCFDVSNDRKLKSALLEIFNIMNDRAEWKYDIKEAKRHICNICEGTCEVIIKNKNFVCPDCEGHSLSKEDWESAQSFVLLYEKAKNENLEALKELLLIYSSNARLVEI